MSIKQRIKRMLWVILITFASCYALLILLLLLSQEKLVYFPTSDQFGTPQDIGIAYQDVELTTSDNVKIHAWWIPARNARGNILVCHGNAGNISYRLEKIDVFYKLGLNVLILDYRGYGKSQGTPSEQGTYLDAQAAWQFLLDKGIPPENIIIMGRSLGGAIAANLSYHKQPKVLILESTFTSVPELGQQVYPWLPVKYLARIQYNTRSIISQIKCPILIIHSREDDIIPFNNGEQLFQLAQEPKEFLEIKGSHNDGYIVSKRAYVLKLRSFLDKYIGEQQKE